ncbi:MAG: N-acetylneuraminate synthase family protein [Lachnospiraceae bacterium]|nr:N-acetylneuraminate synthase family protein [Lachnospiraceae bacterium]
MDFGKRKIIAELGMTHDGSLGQAKCMIKAAAECGVDAVKLQTHISEAETVRNAPKPPYFKGEGRYEFFKRTAFDMDQWKELKECAAENKVEFISSPFSIEAIDFLLELGIDCFKVPSGEITNIPYLVHLAEAKVPVIVSSGMSSLKELDECMEIFLKRSSNVALMQCTSEYPCGPEHVGLNIIDLFKERYPGVPLGFSDHTSGVWASIAAFERGARLIEKHFTLSKLMYGPDAKMSMEPGEMALLCSSVRSLETALLNPVDKEKTDRFNEMKVIFQKSIVAVKEIPKGTAITEDMIGYKKPGTGIPTKFYKEIIGKKTRRELRFDDIIGFDDIEGLEKG